jgi:predicted Zn-dependent protease
MKRWFLVSVLILGVSGPAQAQGVLGRLGQAAGKAQSVADQIKNFVMTEQEEKELGASISERLRVKYGVVQSQAVHKYVALTGRMLTESSSRPNLAWTFTVLDTDGVNAFAAPGGFIHITRGALALLDTEAELAGVLGHEVTHVTEKHTLNAIKKSKIAGGLAETASRSDVLSYLLDQAYANLLENKYDKNDEYESDQVGIRMANKAGYAPDGLGAFLTRLSERNKDLNEPSGVFASHPETKTRVGRLTKQISSEKLTATATVATRYSSTISYKPLAVTTIAGGDGASSLAGSADPKAKPAAKGAETKPAESKSKFGLGGLTSKLGADKTNTGTVASAGSRGVNPDRDAKGGPKSRGVAVTLTPAEIAAFRRGISG